MTNDPSTAARLQVVDKTVVADGVVGLILSRPDGGRLPDWTPGSHIDLILPNGMTRQYSLCGDRWDARRYRVAVLREEHGRGGSAYVHEDLRVGAHVQVGGPRNNFPLAPSDSYLFIAGGIGITPLIPMIIQADLLDVDWTLLYGGRTRSTMAFLDELAAFGDRVVVHPEDEAGLLPLNNWIPANPEQGRKVYCCGPAPLLAGVEARCQNWPPGLLRTERFVAKEQAPLDQNTSFQVELHRSGGRVIVPSHMSVLEAVRGAGVSILSSCEQGLCGTCETQVLSGDLDHRDSLLDDQERQRGDCMFICVSRSRGPRLVLDL